MMTNENSTDSTEASGGAASRYTELQQMVAAMAGDFEKFYNDGNKAAGTRVRLAMQELKNFAQSVRVEVQNIKNGKPGDAGGGDDKED